MSHVVPRSKDLPLQSNKNMNDRRIRIRAEINEASTFVDPGYVEKADNHLFVRLQRMENPTTLQFKKEFTNFDQEFFEDLGPYRAALMAKMWAEHYPFPVRMMFAMRRYLEEDSLRAPRAPQPEHKEKRKRDPEAREKMVKLCPGDAGASDA